jgi:peptide deformylase
MAVLPIIKLFQPNLFCDGSCLRLRTETLSEEDFSSDWFHQLVKDMFQTLYAEPSGIGLSANQVGILKMITVIDFKRDGKNPLVLVNPKLVVPSNEIFVESREACLSFPDVSVTVRRHKTINVLFQDFYGCHHEIEAEGFKANVFQHEIDHLLGKAHVDLIDKEDAISCYQGNPARLAQVAFDKINSQKNSSEENK